MFRTMWLFQPNKGRSPLRKTGKVRLFPKQWRGGWAHSHFLISHDQGKSDKIRLNFPNWGWGSRPLGKSSHFSRFSYMTASLNNVLILRKEEEWPRNPERPKKDCLHALRVWEGWHVSMGLWDRGQQWEPFITSLCRARCPGWHTQWHAGPSYWILLRPPNLPPASSYCQPDWNITQTLNTLVRIGLEKYLQHIPTDLQVISGWPRQSKSISGVVRVVQTLLVKHRCRRRLRLNLCAMVYLDWCRSPRYLGYLM